MSTKVYDFSQDWRNAQNNVAYFTLLTKMHKKKGVVTIYEGFRSRVAAAQRIPGKKKMTYREIAKKTGYAHSTIKAFMCGSRSSDEVAEAISKTLGIQL